MGKEWGFISENDVSSPPPKKNETFYILCQLLLIILFDIVFGIQWLQLVVSCLISEWLIDWWRKVSLISDTCHMQATLVHPKQVLCQRASVCVCVCVSICPRSRAYLC